MANFIIVLILAVILVSAGRYVYKAKKSGVKCIGCPSGGHCCSHKQGADHTCHCGCGGETTTDSHTELS